MKKLTLLITCLFVTNIIQINSEVLYINNLNNFNTQIQLPGITVVKFFADWCQPCKSYAPIFKKFAEQNQETEVEGNKISIRYLSIDVDKAPDISNKCNISSMPTTIFYKNGQRVATLYGSLNKTALMNKIMQIAK